MKALLRAVRRQKPHKNSSTEGHGAVSNQAHSNSAAADETAAAAAPADTNNTPTAQPSGSSTATASVAVLAAATNRLRELAELLDSEGLPAAQNVGAELQVLAQQLLSLPATAATAAAQCAKSSSTAAAPAAAADVESLERSYAAPSAAVAQHAGEVEAAAAATQRLTKKQRRGKLYRFSTCVALLQAVCWFSHSIWQLHATNLQLSIHSQWRVVLSSNGSRTC